MTAQIEIETRFRLSDVVQELRITTQNPELDGLEHFIGFEHIESNNLNVKSFGRLSDGVSFNKTFRRGDVLFGKIRAYLRKVAIAPFDGVCSGDILVLRTINEKILAQELLPYLLTSERFVKVAVDSSNGTTMPRTKWQHISNFELQLPPLETQGKLARIFQSIDQAIEQAKEEENKLRTLAKRLIDGFISEKPAFGNLLKGKELVKVKFNDVAVKMNRRYDPANTQIERIVAGENLESEDFRIRSWGTIGKDFLGPAFHMLFQNGDILYGSRRTYLRKVALADFDGVCANTTYVLRAKEETLRQDLLKHIMLSEPFTQYSIGVSKGSTNPYINWKDLDNFTFQIPDVEIQDEIVSVLDEILEIAERTREQVQTLKNLKFKLLNEILG